ncbi:hypothetical protein [Kitasatospora griseola]|uniref:hypothetical protein n=1 Tax=Kitasatospora griseola TaxID=2064 RepID=UPI00166F6A24|nr:hypothetical protein [Kitasatospora griseola]GGQ94298.1 hypothetical protein GCM10010195_57670 [Kitasatospora griseola]
MPEPGPAPDDEEGWPAHIVEALLGLINPELLTVIQDPPAGAPDIRTGKEIWSLRRSGEERRPVQ